MKEIVVEMPDGSFNEFKVATKKALGNLVLLISSLKIVKNITKYRIFHFL